MSGKVLLRPVLLVALYFVITLLFMTQGLRAELLNPADSFFLGFKAAVLAFLAWVVCGLFLIVIFFLTSPDPPSFPGE